jgi:hypothetical protein
MEDKSSGRTQNPEEQENKRAKKTIERREDPKSGRVGCGSKSPMQVVRQTMGSQDFDNKPR